MRLKRLEVFGFKSFFDKTVITFRPGITGIVGPNGCGKSNFADAILWVLGEQSPKSLRGERMEDVIFGGTEYRKALSVAEVSLTIGDIANELPPPYTPYAELTVSRRLYRSGESEYLINKTACRLKDIRDLLIDMGAGYRAHTIIEQGKVDDLITASPMQRREIVEEAAGIAKYRLRKAEALRKLEATEQNLTRVSDIIGEIKRQRNALDRQAKKAEKFNTLTEKFKTVELQVARHEWAEWRAEQNQIEEEEADLQNTTVTRSAQLATLETDHAASQLSMTQKEENLSDLGRQISAIEKEIQRWESKAEMIVAQRQEWSEAQTRTNQEISTLQISLSSTENEALSIKTEVEKITQSLPEAEALLAEQEEKAKALDDTGRAKSTEAERLKVMLFNLSAQLATSKNNLIHFQARKDGLFKQKERLRLEQETIEAKNEASSQALAQAQTKAAETSESLVKLRDEQEQARHQLKDAEDAIRVKEKQLFKIKEDLANIKAEIASHEGFYRGFLNKREGSENPLLQLEGLQGMVADLVEVPPRYELALEAALDHRLRGIVVENHAEILKGIRHLRNTQMGRGTFFPRNPRIFEEGGRLKIDDKVNDGIIGAALDLVTVQPGNEKIAEALLGGVVISNDFEAALQAWENNPSVRTWVSLDGTVLDQSGVVSGGEQGKKGLLGQKRALQHLNDQAMQVQLTSNDLQFQITEHREISEETGDQISELNDRLRSLDVEHLKLQSEAQMRSSECERLQDELETILFEQEEGVSEEETLLVSETAEHSRIAEAEQSKTEKEDRLEALSVDLREHRQELDTANEAVIQLRMETNSLKEKQTHVLEKQSRVQREKANLTTRLEEAVLHEKALQEKLKSGKVEEGEATSSIETLSLDLEEHRGDIRQAQEAHAALLFSLNQTEKACSGLRAELNQTQEVLQEKALKKVAVEMNRQKIEETILSRYQIKIESYLEHEDDISVEAAKEQTLTLRQALDNIGPVNLAAIEEYKDLDTRFQFLSAQEEDLTQSIESLRGAIAKINKTTRGLFVETFHILNQKFAEVYTDFFGGGSAELVLLDEAHPLESGIELLAQPPGKGKRSILLLSGGEKALTAISLLFATFLIRPTPFCLLDEIDAPLDEENTRRFSQTLEKMSEQTQFIVVTHNKQTMEIADVLYGVTMEETGISKLVSVDLNAPKDLAENR